MSNSPHSRYDKAGTFQVTKLDAARRQLATAILLWFAEADSVSIHTLLFAAHEIIHRAYRNAGHTDLLFDTSTIADEDRKQFCLMLKQDAIWFKHAERHEEWDKTHEFHPGRNELFLVICLFGVGRVSPRYNDMEWAAYTYFLVKYPHWMSEEARTNRDLVEALDQLRGVAKNVFLEKAVAVRRQCEAKR